MNAETEWFSAFDGNGACSRIFFLRILLQAFYLPSQNRIKRHKVAVAQGNGAPSESDQVGLHIF